MVNMAVPYRGPDGMSLQLQAEIRQRFGSREQNKGFVTGYPEAARRGETGGHFPDKYGITHAYDIGVDIELDGTGLRTQDAMWLAHRLRALGKAGKHPFSKQGYFIHDMSETADPKPLITGAFNNWEWAPYTGASPHSDHIHVSTGGDQQWGEAPRLTPAEYNSRASWGIAAPTVATQATQVAGYSRPVPNFIGVSQHYASNPTAGNPHPIFGNYQPRGHTGIDYAAAVGTDTYAVGPGTVLYAGPATALPGDDSAAGWASRWYIAKGFAGNVLVINHGPFLGIYAHLSAFLVRKGDRVVQGQRVALTGNTGASTGPHLHFEVVPVAFAWGNGMYGRINPNNYLALKNVTTTPGYTGGTINATKDWFAMSTPAELRKIIREESRAAVKEELYNASFVDINGNKRKFGEVYVFRTRKHESMLGRTERNTEAVIAAVSPAQVQASVEKAVAAAGASVDVRQLSAQIVADLVKETQK